MNNEYVARMMSMLINKPMNVVWLCVYTDAEPDDEDTWTWDNTDEMKYMDMSEYIDMKYYVLNHTKEVFQKKQLKKPNQKSRRGQVCLSHYFQKELLNQ